MRPKLLLATNNRAKVAEYRNLLEDIPFRLVTLSEQGITTEVDETGETLEENARLKADALSRESGLVALADDSGLEVDALGGEPGILSARYAGEGASDRDKVNYLLARMADIPSKGRTARFRCVIAIAVPGKEILYCNGECKGIITMDAVGKQGFGYDPVFYIPELGKTMAELTMDEKNRISHRGKAARAAHDVLMNIVVN